MTIASSDSANGQTDFIRTNQRLRILFADDTPQDIKLMTSMLSRSGYRLTFSTVDSLSSFEDRLNEESFDIVVCDYNLRDWTAVEALDVLKNSSQDIPLVVVSGSLGDEAAAEIITRGATDYVLKDRLARLPSAIQRALEEKALRAERRQAEEALRQAEENYRSFVHGAPFGFYRSEHSERFVFVNPSLVTMLGYDSEAELLAKSPREIFHENSKGKLLAEYEKTGSFRGVQVDWKRKDGKVITVRATGRGLLDEDGRLRGFEVIAEDITQQRELENQFRQAQKMEAVGRLAGGVAHDFNNMLGIILGHCQLLLERLGPDNPDRKCIEEIEKAGKKASGLTRQLLAFSRKQVIEPRVLDLNNLITDLGGMLKRLLGEDVDVRVSLHPDLGNVKADPVQLEQVLLNLAVNARDAMPEGGKLTIETANITFEGQYTERHPIAQAGSYVMIAVSDTGCGMDRETQTHIFEPFFTTKERGKGTGLGLATVYGIIKQSGGFIWVYSEPGHGTTFKLYLPRVEQAAQPIKQVTSSGEIPTGTETVLLVEDEASLLSLTSDYLQKKGYTVLEAADGAEGLEIAKRNGDSISLLITDVIMPKMNGRELTQSIRQFNPGMKVLYVSGYTDETIAHQGVLEAGTPLLEKPFALQDLGRKVRQILDNQ